MCILYFGSDTRENVSRSFFWVCVKIISFWLHRCYSRLQALDRATFYFQTNLNELTDSKGVEIIYDTKSKILASFS